jgi:hypothetical protein
LAGCLAILEQAERATLAMPWVKDYGIVLDL